MAEHSRSIPAPRPNAAANAPGSEALSAHGRPGLPERPRCPARRLAARPGPNPPPRPSRRRASRPPRRPDRLGHHGVGHHGWWVTMMVAHDAPVAWAVDAMIATTGIDATQKYPSGTAPLADGFGSSHVSPLAPSFWDRAPARARAIVDFGTFKADAIARMLRPCPCRALAWASRSPLTRWGLPHAPPSDSILVRAEAILSLIAVRSIRAARLKANMSTSDVRSAQKDGIRRPKGGVRTLATSTNPAIPNDLIPGQRARTAAEEAIALALKEMPSDQRRALLKELAEEEAPISETKGAA